MAAGAKASVSEYVLSVGTLPTDNSQAGLAAAGSITGNNVASVTVANGIISIAYTADPNLSGGTVLLTPSVTAGSVLWQCSGSNIESRYLPANCRP
ncbi:MAG: pilin [Marinobacter sp.]|nr:pilin [Marinobacter sp.]